MHYLFKACFLCCYVFSKHLMFTLALIIPSHVHTHLVYRLHDYTLFIGIEKWITLVN